MFSSVHIVQLTTIFSIIGSATAAQLTILGSCFCDVCHHQTLSKHSNFLQGVDVNIECRFRTRPRKHVSFSVNTTTDIYGIYKLDIPSVDGIRCSEYPTIQSFCRARLIRKNLVPSQCKSGGTKHTSTEITVRSKQNNVCVYTMAALSYKPPTRNATLCGHQRSMGLDYSFNSSKFFFPLFPPFVFTWPPLPQLPPLPSLPPFPSFPLPWPYPYQWIPNPPSLPFPFPPLPPFSTPPNPPPVNYLGDPRSWIPNIPLSPPPPGATGTQEHGFRTLPR
ncbi:hypothetical protein F511_10750 [Dorcoceras hygrometricum]|uniref:Pollen Ole e 1 allergen and extensin family protein n=1 Tax=Dorcoceras hygrometricum TaxID=472368 RepID=A0A2Z7CHF5_9LAMI|nr:hypothetical protein F511_10750 [Dorcoceras hygrometricum]